MTACARMFKLLDELLAEKKSLKEIGAEMCDSVLSPRTKAIRLIKAHKGEAYLIENAEWLGYDLEKIPTNQSGHNLGGRKSSSSKDVEKNSECNSRTPPEKPAGKAEVEKAMREQMEEDAENKRQELKYGKPVPGIDIHLSYWKTHLCPIP